MSLTLAELAIHIPGSIELFEKYEFDFYQNGQQTLKEACKKNDLSHSKISAELNSLPKNSTYHINMDEIGIERLIDFINIKYHSKEKEILSTIHFNIQSVLTEKNNDKSFVHFIENIEEIFCDLMDNFIRHCNKEEEILFPHINKLLQLRAGKAKLTSNQVAVLKNPIQILVADHEKAVEIVSDIKKWTNRLNIPKNASAAYLVLIKSLKEFEKDFHMHLHLENNILFPKCIALEDELKKRIE